MTNINDVHALAHPQGLYQIRIFHSISSLLRFENSKRKPVHADGDGEKKETCKKMQESFSYFLCV